MSDASCLCHTRGDLTWILDLLNKMPEYIADLHIVHISPIWEFADRGVRGIQGS